MKLKAIQAKEAKPREKPYKLSDGKGLYLLINPKGAKYWRVKYRYGGKEKVLALGVYPEVTLAKAREQCDKAREKLRDGVDPNTTRRLGKIARMHQKMCAFGFLGSEILATVPHRVCSLNLHCV
jgi:hypothetical protein